MIKIWSETPVARVKEQVADIATLAWVWFWGSITWQLFQLLAGFAQAGRTIHSGGQTMIQSGRDLGESLSGIPLIGEGVRDVVRNAFCRCGDARCRSSARTWSGSSSSLPPCSRCSSRW